MNFTLKDNSAAVLHALKLQGGNALNEIGAKAVQYAQKEIDRAHRVDTGALRGSIRAELRQDGLYVGTDNDHAAFHELGTGHYTQPHASEKYGVKPLHFIRKAANHRKQWAKIIKKELKR